MTTGPVVPSSRESLLGLGVNAGAFSLRSKQTGGLSGALRLIFDVRFSPPQSDHLLRCHEMTRCANIDQGALQRFGALFDHLVSGRHGNE